MERFDSCFHPYHACDPHPNEYHENIHYTPDQINALLGLIPYKADRAEVPKMETLNDVNYIGHVATSEALPDKMEQPSWALVGSVKKTKPYFYYVEGFVPKGYRAGWNDLSGVLGTYDLTVDKVSIFDYNLLTEYNVSRNHTQDTRIFSHDWKEQRYFSAFPDYVEGKKYRPCDRVNMPGYTKTSFVAQRSTSKAPFVVKKSNVFTFEDAIALVPEEYRIPGMKVTFVSAYTNQAETWYFKGNSASLWKDKKSWWKIDLEAERNEIHAEEVFIEKMEAPEMVADRAIADENGNRIPDTYLTRKAVRRHIEDTFNDMFIDNPPTVMDGMITPEMLSESTKQLIGNKSITNFADDEDITSVHGQLKLANKRYDPNNYSGKGRCYLRKNLVAGRNILTQSMICWSDTIYVIQYDYDLEGKTITIPSKCTLDFQGGGFSNGTVVGDNTKIEAGLEKIFGAITINGSWDVAAACPEWFGALPDGVHDCTESIQDTINNFDIVKLNNGIYFIGNTIQVRSNITLFGEKGKTIIKSPTTKEFDVNDLPNANTLPYIFYSEKAVKVLFRGLSFILGDYYNGIGFRQSVNGDTDEWDAKIYVENCHFEHGYRAVSIERTYRECRIIDSISYYACGDYAFFMEGTDNSIHNSTVGSCQQGGIYLSQNSRMSNCKVFVANKAWRYKYDAVTPRSKYAVYVSGSYCNVTGLDIQQNCANGIYVGGHDNYIQAVLNANGYQRDKQSSILCANAVLKCSNSILIFTSTTGFLNSYVSHYLYSVGSPAYAVKGNYININTHDEPGEDTPYVLSNFSAFNNIIFNGANITKCHNLPEDFVKNNIHSENVSRGERMYVTVGAGKAVSFDLDVTTFITQYTVIHQYLTFIVNPSLAVVDTPLYEVGRYKLIVNVDNIDYTLKTDMFQNGLVSIESIKYLYDIIPDPKDSQCKLRWELANTSKSAINLAIDYPIIEIYKNNTGYGNSYETNIIPTDLSKDFCKDKKGIYGKVADNTYDINLGIIRFNNAISDSPESYEYIKITKVPTSGFRFLYSTYRILTEYSLLYVDNKLYILSDRYDTGNDSFFNIRWIFDPVSYTLDIWIKVSSKYGKLIVRDTKWATLNTYEWFPKNTDPYPVEAVDAEFITSDILTLPDTLIGIKTYDTFGNILTWSKSDWLNPDGTLVTKVVFASKLNDFIKSNTIYNIIRYIDLEGKTLTVPDNSVLNFIGGTIGNGTIIGNKTKVINLNVDRIVLSGTWFDSGITSNRPTNVLVGFQYFDSTLSKPIYYKGNNEWVDATGATV